MSRSPARRHPARAHPRDAAGVKRQPRTRASAEDCPHTGPAFLAAKRRAQGDLWYRSKSACEFVETKQTVSAADLVAGALSREVAPLFPAEQAEPANLASHDRASSVL